MNRQRGSGTRFQFDQLLWKLGLDKSAIEGYQDEEFTHLAVAATIGGGQADAGYGIKAAAAKYGLEFIPLVNERYFFVCRNESLDEPTVQQLLGELKGAEFRSLVASLPGYDASRAGEVLTVREALPVVRPRARPTGRPRRGGPRLRDGRRCAGAEASMKTLAQSGVRLDFAVPFNPTRRAACRSAPAT